MFVHELAMTSFNISEEENGYMHHCQNMLAAGSFVAYSQLFAFYFKSCISLRSSNRQGNLVIAAYFFYYVAFTTDNFDGIVQVQSKLSLRPLS